MHLWLKDISPVYSQSVDNLLFASSWITWLSFVCSWLLASCEIPYTLLHWHSSPPMPPNPCWSHYNGTQHTRCRQGNEIPPFWWQTNMIEQGKTHKNFQSPNMAPSGEASIFSREVQRFQVLKPVVKEGWTVKSSMNKQEKINAKFATLVLPPQKLLDIANRNI